MTLPCTALTPGCRASCDRWRSSPAGPRPRPWLPAASAVVGWPTVDRCRRHLGQSTIDLAVADRFDRALELIDRADEVGDEARLREFVDFGRRADLADDALVHDRDAGGERHRLFLVVGHDDEGDADLLLDVHDLELRLLAQLLVERAERLVEQQQLRLLGERAGERHALALAARELMRLALARAA